MVGEIERVSICGSSDGSVIVKGRKRMNWLVVSSLFVVFIWVYDWIHSSLEIKKLDIKALRENRMLSFLEV